MLKLLFMKRTKERYDIDEEDEERRAMFAGSISDAMKHQGSRFIAEPSYVNIENLTFGRLAFHGMNPDIEKMAEEVRLKVEDTEAELKEKDVQDEEMAGFKSSMHSTIDKKFSKKRNYNGNKLTPPAAGSSTSNYENSGNNPADIDMTKGQKYVQGMRQDNTQWHKDQNNVKKPKMQKPSTD